MFCHTCGGQLPEALSYCKRCGASLSSLKVEGQAGTPEKAIDTLPLVIVGTTITLLGMALGALVLMNNGQINERLGTAFVILTFVALVVSEGALVWRLMRQNRGSKETLTTPELNDVGSVKAGPSTVRALPEPLEPISSITEPTTRALEPSRVRSERQ